MLTDKYLGGIPDDSRAAQNTSFDQGFLRDDNVERIRGLNTIAHSRGQTLAQMAIAWVLRDQRVTTALIGASRWSQIEDSLGALDHLDFTEQELADIDRFATEGGVNIWERSSRAT
jgi:L-glyceraldehyde 3-phosphate reductase